MRETEAENILDELSSRTGYIYLMFGLHRVQHGESLFKATLNPIYIEICLVKCLVHAEVYVSGVCCILFSLYCRDNIQV